MTRRRSYVVIFLLLVGGIIELLAVAQPHFYEELSGTNLVIEMTLQSHLTIQSSEPLSNITVKFTSYVDEKQYKGVQDGFQIETGALTLLGVPYSVEPGIPGTLLKNEGRVSSATARVLKYPLGKPIFATFTSTTNTEFTITHTWDESVFRLMVMLATAGIFGVFIYWARCF